MLKALLLLIFISFNFMALARAETSVQVVQSFNKSGDELLTKEQLAERDKTRQKIMFVMGIPLLIMLISTAVLGIAMGVFGKKVFVVHMVLASLSLTLAVVHAIVGFVWYFPF